MVTFKKTAALVLGAALLAPASGWAFTGVGAVPASRNITGRSARCRATWKARAT